MDFHTPTVHVLGLALHDLQLGHCLLLQDIESPFFESGAFSPQDVVTAALVCSGDYRKTRSYVERPPLSFALWGWLNRKADFAHEGQLLSAYIDDSLGKTPNSVGDQITPDAMLGHCVFDFHWTMDAALDCPVRRIAYLLRSSGITQELSAESMETLAAARAM